MSKIPYEIALLKSDQQPDVSLDPNEFILEPYEYMTKFIIYPGSDKYRMLIKHGTGLGKTIEALSVAENFIKKGKKVFILTFNESIFINDMLKFPELGFISFTTKEKLAESKGEEHELIKKEAKKEALKNVKIFGYKEFENMFFWTEANKIKINLELLQELYDSVIICDEIHDVYNSDEQNTWGRTIEMVSNILETNIYLVFMSATPLNNPEEIDDLINLMAITDTQSKKWSTIRDIGNSIAISSIDDIKHPVPMSEEEVPLNIVKYMKNKISFVPESEQHMPRMIFKGHTYRAIANIELVPCVESDEFKKYYEKSQNYLHDEEWRKHLCLNFPEQMKLEQFIYEYRKKTPVILEWCREVGVEIDSKDGRDWINGSFLREHTIGRFSPKFEQLLQMLMTVEGKSFIYINGVKNIGVDIISSLLRANGIIGEKDIPSEDTVCFECRARLRDHSMTSKSSSDQSSLEIHKFTPYRFITITGRSKNDNDRSISLFNEISNLHGENIEVVIGSKIIKEGFNILATNNTFVLSMPFNVPNLLQVLGRNARTKSHANLPADKRYVNIYILITASQEGQYLEVEDFEDLEQKQNSSKYYANISREELEYYNKFKRYAEIENYERLMHEVAIDPEVYGKLYFEEESENDSIIFKLPTGLKMLPFKPEQEYIESKEGDYDMRTYYKQKIHRDLFDVLDIMVGHKFKQEEIWDMNTLIDAIIETNFVPNPKKVKKTDIYFAILNHENTTTVGNYVIKTTNLLDIDWFEPEIRGSEIKKLALSSKKQKTIEATELSKYLEQIAPKYCEEIDTLKFTGIAFDLNIEQSNKLEQLLFDAVPKMTQDEFESIMMGAFDSRDLKLLRVLFLVAVPIKKGDIFSVPEDESNDIIGFLSNNRETLNIKQDDGWAKTKMEKQLVEFSEIMGIVTRKQFKLIEKPKETKKDKDKRYEFEGIVCETLGKKEVEDASIYFGLSLKGKIQKIETCADLREKVVWLEFQSRLSLEEKKTALIDFN